MRDYFLDALLILLLVLSERFKMLRLFPKLDSRSLSSFLDLGT